MASNTLPNESHNIAIVRGTVDDGPAVLALLDTAVKWLVSQDKVGQWGTSPFSENPKRAEQLEKFATTGLGLWLAIKVADQTPMNQDQDQDRPSGPIVGALAVGEKMPYAPAVSEPELYVRLLVSDRQCAGQKIGTRLLNHARGLADGVGALLLRVDCYAGGDGGLVRYYESQGFERSERLDLEGKWPCQVLVQRLRVKGE
ncbi:hypothetical protein N7535_005840 [Penicillium sp. DV-2018c]|nr:hypothetical protein N7461_009416 [Penicillium sp. DV-2018c]KAJ5572180.1 hypothetical protein N7535_005840 [Penicillium sp. DV-2018c]